MVSLCLLMLPHSDRESCWIQRESRWWKGVCVSWLHARFGLLCSQPVTLGNECLQHTLANFFEILFRGVTKLLVNKVSSLIHSRWKDEQVVRCSHCLVACFFDLCNSSTTDQRLAEDLRRKPIRLGPIRTTNTWWRLLRCRSDELFWLCQRRLLCLEAGSERKETVGENVQWYVLTLSGFWATDEWWWIHRRGDDEILWSGWMGCLHRQTRCERQKVVGKDFRRKQGRSVCLEQTKDGKYVFAGWTQSFGMGRMDVYIIKTDADGNAGPYPK